ncbi:MAG: phosphoadenosine phosphosulfate reductase family protein [bacterium]|nr:phosphoadenosine phosphosulfate reductase family protein [bacterium]
MIERPTASKVIPPDKDSRKVEAIRAEIRDSYLADETPWVIAYSGGKDSTATLQLVLETVAKDPGKQVQVVYADTRVEPPPVIGQARVLLRGISRWARANNLPVSVKVVYPKPRDNFFVLVLGKGYLPPTRWFRWCTERLKVRPIKTHIKHIIRQSGTCVVLLGTRLKESQERDRRLKSRGYSKWMPFEGLPGATIYAPIFELSVEDVWSFLLDNDPPWGMDHHQLRHLYTGGNTSCSLFCGGIRFGCWVCTVVKKDRCTQGLAELPGWDWLDDLLAYRDLLLTTRWDPATRLTRCTNGKEYLGPLNLRTRKFLRRKLEELQDKTGVRFLTSTQDAMIRDLWAAEKRARIHV